MAPRDRPLDNHSQHRETNSDIPSAVKGPLGRKPLNPTAKPFQSNSSS